VTPGASIELAARLLGHGCSVERPITVDQTNFSVVVDECVVVKWMQPPVRAPHPGVEMIRHLAAAGFAEMPAFVGLDERDGYVHAIVTEFLPGARDGWDWFVDDVVAWLGDELPFEFLIESAQLMGAITARLHAALADLQPSEVDLSTVADQAVADLRLAKSRLEGLSWLDEHDVAAALLPLRETTCVRGHRIHGDLHAGQFLRAAYTMLVTDFDGNPLRDVAGRGLAQSPLRDVASMVQSMVHIGAVVVKRQRPERLDDVERFSRSATAAALDSYRVVHPVDERLLLAFQVAQELHEYAYSIHHLPHWRYVADAALPSLLRTSRPAL
jgi:maltokinase